MITKVLATKKVKCTEAQRDMKENFEETLASQCEQVKYRHGPNQKGPSEAMAVFWALSEGSEPH